MDKGKGLIGILLIVIGLILGLNALEIKNHTKSYINEPFSWNYTIYDLLSISTFYLNEFETSYNWCNKAIEMEPSNKRLLNNKKIIEEKLKSI